MITGHDIGMALRTAYWSMHRRADAHFSQSGVTADQFVLLAALAQLMGGDGGAAAHGITQQELVRRTASDPSTVRAMLVLLEGRRLVARRRHPTDRRARSVTITDKGRRVYQKLWEGSHELRQAVFDACAPTDAVAVVEALHRISQAMSAPPVRGQREALTGASGRTTRSAAPAPRA
jgi:DNA-binding MarR family transcriptional regulator